MRCLLGALAPQLTEQQEFYKKESESLMEENARLLERVKQLVIVEVSAARPSWPRRERS